MRKYILFILLVTTSLFLRGQSHEIGFFLGGTNFIGDIGRTNYIYPNKVAGGFVYKFNINPRIALRGTYTYMPMEGNDADSDNAFRQAQGRSFSNTIHEFAAGVEFNFYHYNISDYRTSYTPYIFTEIAAFNYKSPVGLEADNTIRLDSKYSMSLPVGIGIKGLLSGNIAIAFEVGVRYSFVDDIDYSTPDIPILDFGGNGGDWYAFTGLSIVYTFGRPQCFSGLTR
jgi:hypothetical protein